MTLPLSFPRCGMVQTKRLLALILLVIPGVAWAVSGPADGDFAGAVAVDGRNIHLECKGTGAPTVILISGYRNDAEIWTTPPGQGLTPVFAAVAGFTRVCAYDRPSTILDATHVGRSDPVPMPRTAEDDRVRTARPAGCGGDRRPQCACRPFARRTVRAALCQQLSERRRGPRSGRCLAGSHAGTARARAVAGLSDDRRPAPARS